METAIRRFEKDRNWRVSLPARVLLQQIFIALRSDQLGFIDPDGSSPEAARDPQRRAREREAPRMMVATLGEFLNSLGDAADALVRQGFVDRDDFTEIDAIFVLRHIRRWPKLVNCLCIPV
jgi:hypothetical protein